MGEMIVNGLVFREYTSKPIIRKAMKIENLGQVSKVEDEESSFDICGIKFKSHQKINKGDYIVFLNDDDIYHCDSKVFLERNIVEE